MFFIHTAGAVDCAGDEKRPWDHGVFVPMMLLFPKADVPVVSAPASLTPQQLI